MENAAVPGASTSQRLAAATPGHDHLVSFYEDDTFLVATVAAFVRPALEQGDTAVVVATAEHHDAIRAVLATSPSLTARDVDDRLVFLEARAALDAISTDGRVDPERFRAVVGGIVDDRLAGQDGVRIYGEMVALLWDEGDVVGAIELEDLWNELLGSRRFALLCGYPSSCFDDPARADAFEAVCASHGDVIPTEDFSALDSDGDRRRAVAHLQQQLRAEHGRRAQLQRQLDDVAAGRGPEARSVRDGSTLGTMVAHELGSPTAVLRGVVDLLRNDWAQLDETSIREFLELAHSNVARIDRLASDVLILSRLESGRFDYALRELDLAVLADQAVREVRTATRRDIELDAAPGTPPVVADPHRQLQVLHNLLSNAVKYSPEATVVRVEVAPDACGQHVEVRVRDAGVGIAAADIDELFQPFARLDRSPAGPKGTGLGLYIAKALVEGQGGTIRVDSVEGAGSTFAYTVPLAAAAG